MIKSLFAIFLFMILLSSQVLAIQVVKEKNDTEDPVIETPRGQIELDHTKNEVNFPPGLEGCKIIYPDNEDLPEELKLMSIEEENSDVGAEENSEEIPEDMADILEPEENPVSGGTAPGGTADVTLSSGTTGDTSVDTALNMPETTSGATESDSDRTIGILWYIMGSLILLLLIVVIYTIKTREKKDLKSLA